jgi:hypothetical protein
MPTFDATFGEILHVPSGSWFASKQDLSDAGVHKQIMGGMWGGQGGTRSIVLNEGYVDDEDLGHRIIYTGHGGQDGDGRQVADQEWTRANAGMRVNHEHGVPVRVIRGYKLRSPYAPRSGYRYDGLYAVDRCWREASKHGPLVCRFELVELDPGRAVTYHQTGPTARFEGATRGEPQRGSGKASLPTVSDERREELRRRREERLRDR